MDSLPLLQPGRQASPPVTGWPLLRLGFRPFYLGAAGFAALAIPLWVAAWLGVITLPPVVNPLLWHGHEMLFGFAAAVILGFLLTAGKLWTGLATPRGPLLALLAVCWLLARITALTGPYPVYAVLDLMLLPVVAAIFLSLIIRSRNWRNLPLAIILSLLALANTGFHLSVAGFIDVAAVRTLYAALALIVLVECVIAGRVIPAFTMNATPGLRITTPPTMERVTLLLTAIALGAWVLAAPAIFTAAALALAALLHLLRQWRWHPRSTFGRPVLWILHAAYAWLAIGMALLAAAQLGWISASAGIHALAVGATAGLIIGMMTRTARGHTGRPINVTGIETTAYALIMLAAVLRVFVPLAAPPWMTSALIGAALAWTLAFALYLARYTPWLCTTRLDGRDG